MIHSHFLLILLKILFFFFKNRENPFSIDAISCLCKRSFSFRLTARRFPRALSLSFLLSENNFLAETGSTFLILFDFDGVFTGVMLRFSRASYLLKSSGMGLH